MKQKSFLLSLWLISVGCVVAIPVQADTALNQSVSSTHTAQLPPQISNVTRVTNVEVYETDAGLEVVLTTPQPNQLQPVTSVVNNTVVADIPNAVIDTPQSEFEFTNPVTGITRVTVRSLASASIRIEITGQNAPPTTAFRAEGQEFILGASTTAQADAPIEIIVTGTRDPLYRIPESSVGTRTDTPIINVPQSIQVIPSRIIEEQGATTLGETLRNTAGVTSGRLPTDAPAVTPVIRGFETRNVLRNGQRDSTLRRIAGTSNIERVEVLRGPASVLFGQGDPGGTVNVVTKQPLDEPYYIIEYIVGQYGLHRPAIDISGPFGDSLPGGYRLNASYEWSNSFRDFEETQSFFVSPVVRLIDTEQTQLTAEIEYFKNSSWGGAPELPAFGTVINNPIGEIRRSVNLGEPDLAESETTTTRIGYRLTHNFSDNWSINNEFVFATVDAPENTFALGRSLDDDGRTLQRLLFINPSEESSINFNTNVIGRFATGSVRHELLFGIELSKDSLEDIIDIQPLAPIDIFDPVYQPESLLDFVIPLQNTRTENNSIGFYLQDQISISDDLIFVLGGRFDIADQTYEDRGDDTQSFDRQDQAFSPRVGLVYKPAANVSLYASYTESFVPVVGREQTRDLATEELIIGDPLQPERGRQYEVGIKADWLEQRLSTTLALYDLERTNVVVSGANDPFVTEQTGLQRSQGIELNVVGEVLPGWNILASYAYTDARVVEDDSIEEGNFLINVPQNAASLWTTYQIPTGNLRGLGFGVGLFYAGEQQGDLNNSFSLPSYLRTDAALFYQGDRFRVSLNFQNLFDVNYFEGARGDLRVIPGAPFTVFGKINWEF